MRKNILQILAFCCAMLSLSACQLFPEEETLPPSPILRPYEVQDYKYATVMRGDLELTELIRCTYKLTQEETLSFSEGGLYIEDVHVVEGQQVSAGDVLITLERTSLVSQQRTQQYQLNRLYTQLRHLEEQLALKLSYYDAVIDELETDITELEAAIAELEAAISTSESTPESDSEATPEGTPENDLEGDPENTPESNLAALKQQLETLRSQKAAQEKKRKDTEKSYDPQFKNLNDNAYVQYLKVEELNKSIEERSLCANISGTVTYIMEVSEGQRCQKGGCYATISDLSSAVFIVKEKYSQYYPIGTQVEFTCQSTTYTAHVVDPALFGEEAVASGDIYLKLDQPDPTLSDGARGTLVHLLDQRTNVLYVDKDAIYTSNGEPFVYLLDDNGLRTMQKVTTGLEVSDVVEITSGLKEGDRVIIE